MVLHGTAGVAAAAADLGVDVGKVAVLNKHTTAWLYVRADGQAAAVEGAGSYSIPPGGRRTLPVVTDGPTSVSLIASSAGTKYEIEA